MHIEPTPTKHKMSAGVLRGAVALMSEPMTMFGVVVVDSAKMMLLVVFGMYLDVFVIVNIWLYLVKYLVTGLKGFPGWWIWFVTRTWTPQVLLSNAEYHY